MTIACVLMAALVAADPLYKSSVVGTDYDFITDADPSTFVKLEYKGEGLPEMPDKRGHRWSLRKRAHIFVAAFKDGTHVQISVHAGIADAKKEAMRYAPRIGKLPVSLRRGLRRIVVQPGGRDTTAFADNGLIVLYADNATKRIGTHDLEETLFHESVHASWDERHRNTDAWKEARASDGRFVTRYAQRNPDGEDLAESALFAFALLRHPDRIPEKDREAIREAIPARIAYVEKLLAAAPVEPNRDAVLRTVESDLKRLTPDTPVHEGWRTCDVDLSKAGQLADILSNALMLGLRRDSGKVAAFLHGPQDGRTSKELLRATAKRFDVEETKLVVLVREYLHCNCRHDETAAGADEETMRALK